MPPSVAYVGCPCRRGSQVPALLPEPFAERREVEFRDRLRPDPPMRIDHLRTVITRQDPECLAVDDPRLDERLDRCGPGPSLVAVAILDLDRHPRRTGDRARRPRSRKDRDAAERLHAGL